MFTALALPVFHCLFFFFQICALPRGQQIPVHLMGVEIRPVHAGKFSLSPTTTRQQPHMPVPSTITGFRLTIVFTPKGWVVLAQNFIMMLGRWPPPGRFSRRFPGFLSAVR